MEQESMNDPRFKDLLLDPKFSTQSKKNKKVAIDERFKEVLDGKKFKQVQKVDKYGRKVEIEEGINKEMAKFYYLDEDKTEQQPKKNKDKSEKKDQKSNQKTDKSSNQKIDKKLKKKVKKEEIEQKPQEESDYSEGSFKWSKESSESEDFSQEENEIDFWDEQHYQEENQIVQNTNSSSKLAMVNYDWQNVSAQDIFVLLSSLIKAPAHIKQVIVYPSQFGIEQMKIEQEQGPQNIWNQDVKENKKKKPVNEQVNEWIVKNNETDNAIDASKLRQYERDRMKYYFAVIECDNKKTAEYIYDQCDGLEFELTSMKIDLRFVDKDQTFPNQPKEVCKEVKNNGKVNNFLNRSLNHTNVKLTWDEPNHNRFDFINDDLLKDEKKQKQVDWSQYIGVESNSHDDDENDDENSDNSEQESSDSDPFQNKKKKKNQMEITFESGFHDLGDKIMQKQMEKGMNFYEKQQLRKQQKKDKYQEEKLVQKEYKKIQNNTNDSGKYINLETQKLKAQLELLTDKPKKKDNFRVNVQDDRFKAIYEKSEFHIDPTHKSYKDETSGKILQQQILQRKSKKLL